MNARKMRERIWDFWADFWRDEAGAVAIRGGFPPVSALELGGKWFIGVRVKRFRGPWPMPSAMCPDATSIRG